MTASAPTSVRDASGQEPGTGTSARPGRTSLLGELGWAALACLTTLVVWLAAWAADFHRYVLGDTTNAYYGWFYDYGRALRAGHWPLLSVDTMSAGNHVAEGQMGLYSPLSALIGLGTTVAPNLVVYMVLVKFALALLGAVGAYALARSYGVIAPLAAVAATAVPLCGLTMVAEAPRWFTGQMCVALVPWAWWLTRRTMRGASPLPALAACVLVVTVGYIYGTIYLICVLLGLIVQAAAERRWPAVRRGLLVGVVAGLVALAVYLPGVLTLSVTLRNTGIGDSTGGDDTFRIDRPWGYLLLGQLAGGGGVPSLRSAGTPAIPQWFNYFAWYLPLFAMVRWRTAAKAWRSQLSLLVPLLILTLWSIGPYQLGPIRWPGRINDVYALVLVTLLMVLLSRFQAPASRKRLGALLGVLLACALVGLLQSPHSEPRFQLLAVVFLVVVLTGVWQLLRHPRAVAAVMLAVCAVVGLYQVVHYPALAAPQRNMPTHLSAYKGMLPGAVGGVMVIDGTAAADLTSNPYTIDRARYLLTGSLWDLTDKHVLNGYSTIGFKPYSLRYCTQVGGDNCPQILQQLFTRIPGTHTLRVDALSISTLVVGTSPTDRHQKAPAGWHKVDRNPYAVTWVRDHPVPPPGGVVWTSPGVKVEQVGAGGDLGVRFRVVSVPPGGGDVALSRIAWPGYTVQGGQVAAPLDQMFLDVHLDGDAAGHTVAVSFRPPGWHAEEAALGLAALITLGWVVLDVRRRRRRPRGARVAGDHPSAVPDPDPESASTGGTVL